MNPLRGFTNLMCRCQKKIGLQYSTDNYPIKLDKVLILSKLSKLNWERLSHPELSEKELKENVLKRNGDYDRMVETDRENEEFIDRVTYELERIGVIVKRVHRFTCTQKDVDWCDAVFPVGGDGTFLHASRYINDRNKPIIGLNSAPTRSVGFLCLPKKYSSDISLALKALIEGKFRWIFRTRIRISVKGRCESPMELHNLKKDYFKGRGFHYKESLPPLDDSDTDTQKLPILALNEVFMSEVFAAKVSYFELRLDNSQNAVRIKSSGICISTGTGSTSWFSSLNSVSKQDIKNILNLYHKHTETESDENFEDTISKISESFGDKLKFGAEEQMLGYTIRELISMEGSPNPKFVIEPRGFTNVVEIKSRCVHAGLIVDGGLSFPFEDGAVAYLETRPEDALRTVKLLE